MPDPEQNDPRRAYSNAPVNRRTAPKAAPRPQAPPPAVRARTQQARQRQELGAPLSELLARSAADGVARQHSALHPAVIGAAICAVAAVSALVLIRSGAGLALAGALLALSGACWLWQRRITRAARQTLSLQGPPSASASPFDGQALRRIDQMFEAAAAAVSEPVLERLIALKTSAARMALAVNRAEVDGDFTVEHRLYVIEAIRRYIPDTLSAYLQVPPAQRALPGAQAGPSADQLLLAQLALLQSELEQREQLLHAGSVEPLLRQQRFLQAKAAGD
ncbi:MAG: hypothetical protein NTZ64_04625 [Polaromonas sp.]|nr:hypothetical protein [Polaromonas sp.]